MSLNEHSERVSEALIRATQRPQVLPWSKDKHAEEPFPNFSIAISREAGARGTEVARLVGERLGWAVYDDELLEMIAHDLNVRVKLVESVDERHISWLQDTVEAICDVASVREATYVRQLTETMLSLGARGNCLIVGRGSPFVLPSVTTLRVRLTAPLEDRIVHVAAEQHLSRMDAARQIARLDQQRAEFVAQHFHVDPADATHYDLVVNTSRFPLMECAELIIDALHVKQHEQAASVVA
jgi:cytidylate kinase